MRILITTGIYPPSLGGPATYVKEISKLLVERGHEVKVVTYSDEVVDEQNVFSVLRKQSLLKRYFGFVRLVRKHSQWADIIYTHDLVSAGFPTVYAANKPVVVRLGGDFLWEKAFNNGWTSVGLEKYYSESKNFKEKIFLYIYKYVLKKSAKIIFSTDWQKNILCEVFNIKDKSVVIENAFTKNTVLKNHIKAEKNNEILYAGRLVRLKNLKTLLEAIKLDSELGLHIIGKGPEKNNLVGLVKELGVTGQVRFSDAKDHNDLQKTISSARVVVVPSVSDVSPQIIYESISLGIPVVATKSCGYFEKLKNNVRFVDSFDKNALAAALKNPNNNLNINISHNWNILVDEHEKVFKELV